MAASASDAPCAVTIDEIRGAHERIRDAIHETPVITCAAMDDWLGCTAFFKGEHLQRVGAFKFRGATNAVRSLGEDEATRGVLTHSSGNHAQALARAARERGIPAWIVMPVDAPAVKRRAVEGYGATVVTCENTLAAREATAERVARETGATFIHPYDDDRIIAGQGTAALELHQQVPNLDLLIAPVGGGGLLAGTTIATRAIAPDCDVWAAEPALADDAARGFAEGRRLPPRPPVTIADGLRTALSERTFAVMRAGVSRVVTVSENEIRAALRFFLERSKHLIEPSSAVPLAALRSVQGELRGQRVGVILSGGNVDLDRLPALLEPEDPDGR